MTHNKRIAAHIEKGLVEKGIEFSEQGSCDFTIFHKNGSFKLNIPKITGGNKGTLPDSCYSMDGKYGRAVVSAIEEALKNDTIVTTDMISKYFEKSVAENICYAEAEDNIDEWVTTLSEMYLIKINKENVQSHIEQIKDNEESVER